MKFNINDYKGKYVMHMQTTIMEQVEVNMVTVGGCPTMPLTVPLVVWRMSNVKYKK